MVDESGRGGIEDEPLLIDDGGNGRGVAATSEGGVDDAADGAAAPELEADTACRKRCGEAGSGDGLLCTVWGASVGLEEFVGHPTGLAADGDGLPAEVIGDDGAIEDLDERALGVAVESVGAEAGRVAESEAVAVGSDDGGGAGDERRIAECVGGGGVRWGGVGASGEELAGEGSDEDDGEQ